MCVCVRVWCNPNVCMYVCDYVAYLNLLSVLLDLHVHDSSQTYTRRMYVYDYVAYASVCARVTYASVCVCVCVCVCAVSYTHLTAMPIKQT